MVDINTKPRLVIDYKLQNGFIEDRPFRYEQMADFILDLRRDDHLTSWDVADAFHHVWLASRESTFLAFRVAHVIYFPLTMPFGVKLAPWVWTKILRPVVASLRARGFKIMPYMDDFGSLAETPHRLSPVSQEQATAGRVEAIAVFRNGRHADARPVGLHHRHVSVPPSSQTRPLAWRRGVGRLSATACNNAPPLGDPARATALLWSGCVDLPRGAGRPLPPASPVRLLFVRPTPGDAATARPRTRGPGMVVQPGNIPRRGPRPMAATGDRKELTTDACEYGWGG